MVTTTEEEPGRLFELGDVLSATTGYLLTPRHVDGLYDILSYLTGAPVFTHQLARAADAVKPFIFERYPALADFTPPDDIESREDLIERLKVWEVHFGSLFRLEPIPEGVFELRDPIEELQEMAPHMTVIPVAIDVEVDHDE